MTKDYYIYDIVETLKLHSDDSDVTYEHISFLIDDVRSLLLRQKYDTIGSIIPMKVRQTIYMNLALVDDNVFMSTDKILSSTTALPKLVESFNFMKYFRVDTGGENTFRVHYVPIERFPYVGFNNLLKDLVYVTIGQDNKLIFKGYSSKHRLLENVRVFAIFENPEEAWKVSSAYDNSKNFNSDIEYPIDLDMWVTMKEIIIKQLGLILQNPGDKNNNADES